MYWDINQPYCCNTSIGGLFRSYQHHSIKRKLIPSQVATCMWFRENGFWKHFCWHLELSSLKCFV